MDGWELRESDLEDEGREKGMSQALTQARAKANAWGMEARKRNKEGGSEEGGNGWMDTDTLHRGGLI